MYDEDKLRLIENAPVKFRSRDEKECFYDELINESGIQGVVETVVRLADFDGHIDGFDGVHEEHDVDYWNLGDKCCLLCLEK